MVVVLIADVPQAVRNRWLVVLIEHYIVTGQRTASAINNGFVFLLGSYMSHLRSDFLQML